MKKTRFILTGATGLVGINLLWEIIKNNLSQLDKIEVFILGRSGKNDSLEHRIKRQLFEDGVFYITADIKKQNDVLDQFSNFCRFINFDFIDPNERMSNEHKNLLQSAPIDFFYHVGASTDLRDGNLVESLLLKTNVEGTKKVLNLVSQIKVDVFSCVGTAYSCGEVSGNVSADYVNIHQNFRNPYEKSKLLSEIIVREYAKKSNIKYKIFRPSVVGGRLIENPTGSVNKFDVFYGWAAFFVAMKKKHVSDLTKLYEDVVDLDIRVCFNPNSGLNIVPVDFVAKAMYLITTKNVEGTSYHLVSKNELPHKEYIPAIFKTLNLTGIKHVEFVPEKKNSNEVLYYRTAGKVLTPYITSKPINLLVDNYEEKIKKYSLDVPTMTIDGFVKLLNYAKKRNFGLF